MGKPWTPEQKEAARERERIRREARDAAKAAALRPVRQAQDQDPAAKPEPPGVTEAAPNPVQEPLPAAPVPELELDEHEREQIRAAARQIIEEDLAKKKKAERATFIQKETDKEILRQRRLAGLTDHQDDQVEFLVNVAPYSPGLIWDGHVYPHGSWITKDRRTYDSMRDVMARSWEAEDRAGNPNKKFEEWRAAAGVMNPMLRERRTPDGTYTLGLEYGVTGQSGTISGRTTYRA